MVYSHRKRSSVHGSGKLYRLSSFNSLKNKKKKKSTSHRTHGGYSTGKQAALGYSDSASVARNSKPSIMQASRYSNMFYRESQVDEEEDDDDDMLRYEPIKRKSRRVSYASKYENSDDEYEAETTRRSRRETHEDRSRPIKRFDSHDDVMSVASANDDQDATSNPDAENTLVLNWDENEHTLISALLHTDASPPSSPADKLHSLINRDLPLVFDDKSASLKQAIVRNLHPVIAATSRSHAQLSQAADKRLGEGALAYDAACKRFEKGLKGRTVRLEGIWGANKEKMNELEEALNEAYAHRQSLWDQLEKDMQEIDTAIEEEYDHITVDGERIIEAAEKKYKKIEKEEEAKLGKAKLLESMLKKI